MLSLALALSFGQVAAATPAPPPRDSATVIFAGDVVPHGDVLASLRAHGHASLLGPVAGVLARADLALVNLETPVVPSRPESPDGTLRFNAPERMVTALAEAGVDGVSLANNHGYDQGTAGITETIATLRAHRVAVAGASDASGDPLTPARFPVAGATLCVMGVTRILNFEIPRPDPGTPRLALARPEVPDEERALLARVREESERCDALVVSVHTGVEYTDVPEARDRVFFRALAAAGADAIVGHHSHTPHPVEAVRVDDREVPVFYSLGNLVSAQGSAAERAPLGQGESFQVVRDARTREGLLAVMRFTRASTTNTRLRLATWGYTPLWTQNDREVARSHGAVPVLSAAAMPWRGGASRFFRGRWDALVNRIGATLLWPVESLPGADTAYAPSDLTAPARAVANR